MYFLLKWITAIHFHYQLSSVQRTCLWTESGGNSENDRGTHVKIILLFITVVLTHLPSTKPRLGPQAGNAAQANAELTWLLSPGAVISWKTSTVEGMILQVEGKTWINIQRNIRKEESCSQFQSAERTCLQGACINACTHADTSTAEYLMLTAF